MKYNKILFALALCAAIQPNMSFCMENPLQEEIAKMGQTTPQSQTRWQRYAPQFMQNTTSYISKQAASAYDTVNNWSTRKKIIVAGTILTALAAVYNRDQIMQWVNGILKNGNRPEWMDSYEALEREKALADFKVEQLKRTPNGERTEEFWDAFWAAKGNFDRLINEEMKMERKLKNAGVSSKVLWNVGSKIVDEVRKSLKK